MSGQNEIILLLFLIVVIISRYIEIISRQNKTIHFNVPNCRDCYPHSIYRDNKSTKSKNKILVSNCCDNKSIYRDNKSTK